MSQERSAKRGLSREETDYISKNITEDPEMVAAHLGRPVETVVRAIARLAPIPTNDVGVPLAPRDRLLKELHDSPLYRTLKLKFDAQELRLYEDQYCLLMEQLGEETVVSERIQVNQLLTHMILADRNLIQQRLLGVEIADMRNSLADITVNYPMGQERPALVQQRIMDLTNAIGIVNRQVAGLSSELKDLENTQAKLLEGLKATRNQRLERIEGRTRNMLDLVKDLMKKDKADAAGRQAALFRQAALKKTEELSQPHNFPDGKGFPLLNCDTYE